MINLKPTLKTGIVVTKMILEMKPMKLARNLNLVALP